MAKQAVVVEAFYNGVWNAVPCYTRDAINLSRGAGGEGQDYPPSTGTLTVDNRTGAYSPLDPSSALYGIAGRNTPMRVTVGGSRRIVGEALWAPDQDLSGDDAWLEVSLGGLMRRLGQGQAPARSPMYRHNTRQPSMLHYWPLEEGPEADQATNAVVGGPAMVQTGGAVGFGLGDGLPGSPKIVNLSSKAGELGVDISGTSGPTGWGVEWQARFPVEFTGAISRQFITLYTTGTLSSLEAIAHSTSGLILSVGGNNIGSYGNWGSLNDGQLHLMQVDLAQSGGNITIKTYKDGINITSDVYPGTLGELKRIEINPLQQAYLGTMPALGHVSVHSVATPYYSWQASNGHLGELAWERFARLCTEEGISYAVVGTLADAEPMGVQRAEAPLELLRECARTDDGVLFDDRDSVGLIFRLGRYRWNRPVALALDFRAGYIGTPLRPVYDDQNIRNSVSANDPVGGLSAQAVQSTGRMGTQAPPTGVGRYEAQVDVSTATSGRLLQHAYWHLARGTIDEVRYPQVTVITDAAPGLVSAVDAVEIGDRITISNLPLKWGGPDANLSVIGVKERIESHKRLVTFVCIPASQFEVGVVGAAAGGTDVRGARIDTENSTLAAGVNQYLPTLSVASTGGVLWSTDAADYNPALNGGGVFITVGGEVMRVDSVSGASSPQTFTVVRSVNGVVKSHLSGAPVRVRYPVRVGL